MAETSCTFHSLQPQEWAGNSGQSPGSITPVINAEKFHPWVTLLMLARGLIAPSDCVSLSRNFTNNHNCCQASELQEGQVTFLCSTPLFLRWGAKKVSYRVSIEPSCCLLLPSSHAGKGRGEYGSSARLGKEPGNQVGGIKVLPLGVKAIFALSGGLQPNWEGKQKWVTKCRKTWSFSPTKTSHWGGEAEDA